MINGRFPVFVFLAVLLLTACATKEQAVPEPLAETVVSEPSVEIQAEEPPEPFEPLIDMIMIPGGSFRMGTSDRERNERPVHTVTLNGFFLGKYEVTQGEYFEVTGERPSSFRTNTDDDGPDGWKKLPVEQVSWYDALVFCNKLSIKENLHPFYHLKGSFNPDDWGKAPSENNREWNNVERIFDADGYRLPTEAEWEYAARGGGSSRNLTYAGNNNPGGVAWYYDNSQMKVREVGKKTPNELGLYDMSGNVMEWCWDWLGNYSSSAKTNPSGPPTFRDPTRVQYKVIRGGSYSGSVLFCRVAYRHNNTPSFVATNLGFRVARNEPKPAEDISTE